jgi:signal transduction histidine kinase/ActR/RegA family two-component response regulator
MTSASFLKLAAPFAAGTALLILCAYAFGIILPIPVPSPWTCVGFLSAGTAILLNVLRGQRPERRNFRIAGAILLVIGCAIWGENLTAPHPVRPGTSTGFNFILTGLGLVLLSSRRSFIIVIREICALASFTFCYFTLTGIFTSPAGSAAPGAMVPLTAALFLAVAVCIPLIPADGYLVTLLRDSGPAGIIARWLMPVPFILPVMALLIRNAGQRYGLIDAHLSGSVVTFIDILAAILIVWRSSSQVLAVDKLRREAEEALRKSRDDLDLRINLRTRELQQANTQMESEIADRKRAEDDLRKANLTLTTVIETSPLGICTLDLARRVKQQNAAAEAMGIASEPEFDALIDRALNGEQISAVEFQCTGQQKRSLRLNVWVSPLLDINGIHEGVLIIAADVSERTALETKMRQTQKLESLGVLAGGIAHDFNNLLTGIMGNASLALDILPPEETARPLLNNVVAASHRAGDLTRQLLAYAGKGRFVLENVDLSHLVREISALIQSSIPKGVQVHLNLAGDLPPIEADASQIQQIVMNLVINGSEAIKDSGTVLVATGSQELDQSYINHYVRAGNISPGIYVCLEVSDTGMGMDEETQSRIFDPFFTTKFTGRGLGLAAVQGIVRGHKGALRIYSEVGKGTTFKLFFPAAVRRSETHRSIDAGGPDLHGSGTILVIDDEDFVLRMARDTLERLGFDVETAATGVDGLEIFAARHPDIRAVLLDLTMPGMSGPETFTRLKRINPGVAVILSSGFNEVEVVQHFKDNDLASFVQKPYTAAQLRATLRTVLEADPLSQAN